MGSGKVRGSVSLEIRGSRGVLRRRSKGKTGIWREGRAKGEELEGVIVYLEGPGRP